MAEADDFIRGDTLETIMDILDEDTLDEVFEKDVAAAMEVSYKKANMLI